MQKYLFSILGAGMIVRSEYAHLIYTLTQHSDFAPWFCGLALFTFIANAYHSNSGFPPCTRCRRIQQFVS